jgi:dTDP-4-amino-4,6-dideoxygalactose transaminase
MIPVTKPFLPPIEEYQTYLKGIWDREYLTNHGPLLQDLELQLKDYLGVNHLHLVSNGTIALQIAIKALKLSGEIITTPFSYVATTSSIVWEGCTPVFVDIDPDTLNIDPRRIEAAITEHTSAILATHVFGNPCDIRAIQQIADDHNLKIIYDAAHCFGTTYAGESVFNFGDIITTSFHATKLFHTTEGGAVFTNDAKLHDRMWYLRNFGHAGYDKFDGIGVNGKNSEFHAAMGLCNLKYIDQILLRRKIHGQYYQKLFSDLPVQQIRIQQDSEWNYAYFPLIFTSEEEALRVKSGLEESKVFPRRYFYPSLNQLDYTRGGDTPISVRVAESILCLPLYYELQPEQQDLIYSVIKNHLG